jgi:hypothetical protein
VLGRNVGKVGKQQGMICAMFAGRSFLLTVSRKCEAGRCGLCAAVAMGMPVNRKMFWLGFTRVLKEQSSCLRRSTRPNCCSPSPKPWNKVGARPPGLLSSGHDLLAVSGGPPFHAAERHISSWPTRHSPGAPLPASLSQTKAASKAWARSTDAYRSHPMSAARGSRLRGELLQFHSRGVDQIAQDQDNFN